MCSNIFLHASVCPTGPFLTSAAGTLSPCIFLPAFKIHCLVRTGSPPWLCTPHGHFCQSACSQPILISATAKCRVDKGAQEVPRQAPQRRGIPYKFPIVIKFMAQDRAQFVAKLLSSITFDPHEAYPDIWKILKHIEGVQYPWSEIWYPMYSISAPFISTDYE